jgi:hypothetical protein
VYGTLRDRHFVNVQKRQRDDVRRQLKGLHNEGCINLMFGDWDLSGYAGLGQ